jgi:hypothetical protein
VLKRLSCGSEPTRRKHAPSEKGKVFNSLELLECANRMLAFTFVGARRALHHPPLPTAPRRVHRQQPSPRSDNNKTENRYRHWPPTRPPGLDCSISELLLSVSGYENRFTTTQLSAQAPRESAYGPGRAKTYFLSQEPARKGWRHTSARLFEHVFSVGSLESILAQPRPMLSDRNGDTTRTTGHAPHAARIAARSGLIPAMFIS